MTSVKSLLRWNVHCKKQLEHSESLMLSSKSLNLLFNRAKFIKYQKLFTKFSTITDVRTPFKKFYVDLGSCVGNNDRVWTLAMNTDLDHETHTPIVLLHGYISALAFWMLNLDSFAAERPVYAVDLLGFGKSSRPNFSQNPFEIEQQYVMFLEKWRETMQIEKMILLGSFSQINFALSRLNNDIFQ